jgi:hypothetical protein
MPVEEKGETMKRLPSVEEMLADWLRSSGHGGLYIPGECACSIDNLVPCLSDVTDVIEGCRPGAVVPCPGESCEFGTGGCGFHVGDPDAG